MISTRNICLRNSINMIVDFSLNENGLELMMYSQVMEQYLTFLDHCYSYKQTALKDNFGVIAQVSSF